MTGTLQTRKEHFPMPKYQTELLQQLTAETVQQKIDECTARMDKEGFTLVSFSFMDAQTAVLVFKKGLKGSML